MSDINITALTFPSRTPNIEYGMVSYHAISGVEIFIILLVFAILSYLYILVHKDKEKYTRWINPNGREINLYKKIKIFFWLYVAIVIILGLIQTLYMGR